MVPRTALCIALIALLCCCTTTMKRYRSTGNATRNDDLADLYLSGVSLTSPGPANQGKTLLDLSADAQSQFIRIMNARFSDNGKFLKSLKYRFVDDPNQVEISDYVTKEMKLVFSVTRNRNYSGNDPGAIPGLTPADRIEYLRISLRPDDSCLTFREWNMYATGYGTVDIGNVSFSGSIGQEFTTEIPVMLSGNKGSLAGKLSGAISRKEDQDVRYRYMTLNGRLCDSMIVIEEEGTREMDLAGNIIAGVKMRFREAKEYITSISYLTDTTGRINPPEKLSVSITMAMVPAMEHIRKEIKARMAFDFVYRNVIAGQKTFPEWDDRVKYFTGHREKQVTLLRDIDYVPGFYSVGTGLAGKERILIAVETGGGEFSPLVFRSYGEAASFASWLREWLETNPAGSLKIGNHVFRFNGEEITAKLSGKYSFTGVIPYYFR
ncbi:MAG TPA: hypothetical protein VMT63_04635 [Bacteroidales bacterium]|nr:hypothetical protein [Bacteroidales bacterium]